MRIELAADERKLVAAAGEVADVAARVAGACEAERRPPREVWEAYREAGLKGMLVPAAKGGHALSATAMARISEILGTADPAVALTVIPQEYCMQAIAAYGDAPWHGEILGQLMAGEKLTGFLLTEPTGGSDAAAIQSLAVRDGNAWRLNGSKAWVSNAHHADEYFVFVQTEAGSGSKGIAGFLVPRTAPGVTIGSPYEMLGGHAVGIADVTFDDVALAPERLVVPPGEGLRAALSAIDLARINVAAMCCGTLQAGLDAALDYATTRQAFGRPIASFQGLHWELAEVATELYAARLMAYDAAAALDRDGRASLEAAHAKKFATRVAMTGLGQCMQSMGANGLKHDRPLARHFAQAKIAQCLDGTTEIQNVVISRALLRPFEERMQSASG
ncbi:MAG: acyl-CoA dehydrogenase family protein [Alphaproteobacteria bacterium]|jgi:alkylation response protein AidB-like acyl-CoA dehydrogenase|nr:acyl-CoA dehydrogenase family protein [Alphaproteobacteria bacterium]